MHSASQFYLPTNQTLHLIKFDWSSNIWLYLNIFNFPKLETWFPLSLAKAHLPRFPGRQELCHCGHSFRMCSSWYFPYSPLHKKFPCLLPLPPIMTSYSEDPPLVPHTVSTSGERTSSRGSTGSKLSLFSPMTKGSLEDKNSCPVKGKTLVLLCTYDSCPYF